LRNKDNNTIRYISRLTNPTNPQNRCILLSMRAVFQTKPELAEILKIAKERLLICSPYIKREGVEFIYESLMPVAKSEIEITLITDLSPANISQNSTDPEAIQWLRDKVSHFKVFHLPNLHAKVYLVDQHAGIITSGNLTQGGLSRNFECGVLLSEANILESIRLGISNYAKLGSPISSECLDKICNLTKALKENCVHQKDSIPKKLVQEFEDLLTVVQDELVLPRLLSTTNATFRETILYLLKLHGPMQTKKLHHEIQAIHPDLCDDTIDRVIHGKHYGKKWKHAVRSAQQNKLFVLQGDGKWAIKK
jgi:phosphatidylserine/phosphatidylglycerophosphate/cardiolipin synthase-like enzyme